MPSPSRRPLLSASQTLLFTRDEPWTLMLVLVLAVATMLVGALGALAQDDMNRLLSFLLVSHIGFMLFGLAVFDAASVSGAALYAAHHITVLATLFLVSGLITRRTGTVAIDQMGGLLASAPGLAVLFAIPALTLAGLPPTAGFVAKLVLLQAGAAAGPAATAVAGVVIAAGLLTLYALGVGVGVGVGVLGRAGATAARRRPHRRGGGGYPRTPAPMYLATAGLVAASLAIAVFAGPLTALTGRAGVDLLSVVGGVLVGVLVTVLFRLPLVPTRLPLRPCGCSPRPATCSTTSSAPAPRWPGRRCAAGRTRAARS